MAPSNALHEPSHIVNLQLEMNNPNTWSNGEHLENEVQRNKKKKNTRAPGHRRGLFYWLLVIANYLFLTVGGVSSGLLSRFYFMHGGSRRWISCLTQSAGFPVLFIPLAAAYYMNPSSSAKPFGCFTPKVWLCTILLGLLIGFDNFTYSWGVSFIPVSVNSLLLSSQLAFTALFACLIVKQPMNFCTLNCILLLTLSSALVGITSSRQTPAGVTNLQYALGAASTLVTAVLYGLYLPLLEVLNNYLRKREAVISFSLVLETQIVILATATVFSCVGMAASGDFGRIMAEASGFGVGPVKYWLCLVFGSVSWQMNLVGSAGLLFLTSSLMSGICTTALIPANVIAPFLFFHEGFNAEKGFAVILSMWGFSSYLFGEYKQKQVELKRVSEIETLQN